MRGYSGLANPTPCRDILWIKLRINNYRIKVAGTHIPSCLVAPDDNNLVQIIKITMRVALWKSEVLLNQKIFSKILISFYTFSLCSDYIFDPLKMFRIMVNNKQLLSAVKWSVWAPSLMVQHFLRNDCGLSFMWSTAFSKSIRRKCDSNHQELAFFRRCFVAFHKKVTCVGATALHRGKCNQDQLALMANWLTMATCKLARHWSWAIRHETLTKFIIIIIYH